MACCRVAVMIFFHLWRVVPAPKSDTMTSACGKRILAPYTKPLRAPLMMERMGWLLGSSRMFVRAVRRSEAIGNGGSQGLSVRRKFWLAERQRHPALDPRPSPMRIRPRCKGHEHITYMPALRCAWDSARGSACIRAVQGAEPFWGAEQNAPSERQRPHQPGTRTTTPRTSRGWTDACGEMRRRAVRQTCMRRRFATKR